MAGIPLSKREVIFDRGQRVDTLRPGQGVGLAVAREITEQYEGKIVAGESMLGGARMEVILVASILRRKMNKYVHTSRITLSIRYNRLQIPACGCLTWNTNSLLTGPIFLNVTGRNAGGVKRGFNNFIDPISPDELAGLAMESEVDSRLVSHQDGNGRSATARSKATIISVKPTGHYWYRR